MATRPEQGWLGRANPLAENPLAPPNSDVIFPTFPRPVLSGSNPNNPVDALPTGAELVATFNAAVAASEAATTNTRVAPVALDLSGAPAPSQERQPRLNNNTRQGSRFTDDGTARPQVFDISSFRSEIFENEVLPTHSYLVTFAPFRTGFNENAPLTRFVTNKRNTLVMRCESIVLPTSSLLEEENIRRYGYGPVEKVPYGIQFSDVIMTWLVDKRSEIIDFFHQWMNTIVMHDSPSTLMTGGRKRDGLSGYDPFEIGYKDAYTNPIVRIYVYNRQNQTVTTYEMYDVFPMNIQAMNLAWEDENQVQKLSITFAYTNMRVDAPLKLDEAQANFLESGQLPPGLETPQASDRGGVAARDAAGAPLGESTSRTAGASRPNATEPVQPPPISPDLPGLPTIRDFTSPPPP